MEGRVYVPKRRVGLRGWPTVVSASSVSPRQVLVLVWVRQDVRSFAALSPSVSVESLLADHIEELPCIGDADSYGY